MRRSEQKWIDRFTYGFFILLAVLAVIYFKERLFSDSSYYLFYVVNNGTFWIEHGRFVLALSQLGPLIGTTLGLSLKGLLVVYSVGHVLFCLLVFLIARYRYNDLRAGPYLIMIQLLGITSGYFAPMFELYYGAAILALFAAIIYSDRRSAADWILMIVGLAVVLTSHPMGFVLAAFVLVVHWLDHAGKWKLLHTVSTLVIGAAAVAKLLWASGYERARSEQVLQVIRENPLGLAYWTGVGGLLLELYVPVLLIWLWTVIILFKKRATWKGAVLVAAFFGALLLANLQNYGLEHTRYQDQAYFPLSVIAAFGFAAYVSRLHVPAVRRVLWVGLVILLLYKVHAIRQKATHFERRVQTMERLIAVAEQHPGSKFEVTEANISKRVGPGPSWSYPIESLLISSMHGRSISIALDTDLAARNNRDQLTEEAFLLRRWDIYPLDFLNGRYFELETGNYVPLNTMGYPLDSLLEVKDRFGLTFDATPAVWPTNEIVYLPVTVRNRTGQLLGSSADNDVYLSYHWVRDEETVVWDGLRTAFETDVDEIYAQELEVQTPKEPGQYTLVADLVFENRAWLGIDLHHSIKLK